MYNWVSLLGKLDQEDNKLIFRGSTEPTISVQAKENTGIFLCDQTIESIGIGNIHANITFRGTVENVGCQFIIENSVSSQGYLTAGIGTSHFATVRVFKQNVEEIFAAQGEHSQLKQGKPYHLSVRKLGSRVSVHVDGVNIITTDLPYSISKSQVGIWCKSKNDIEITNFNVEREDPTVFVVMQFTDPYNELYNDVIKPVCKKFKLSVLRADDIYGPGHITKAIESNISGSSIVIADISPVNPNVYYEVGYAHALGKPTILIADRKTVLPFDVSPFRTLFYEDSIAGKSRVEAGLKKHLEAVLGNGAGI
ncbi:MAG: hypothetical protein P9X24_15375 [Candidatus Hatepunaea meridiana]|nr:hypothetical protein [Candidatus Hatepunaea meridiana]